MKKLITLAVLCILSGIIISCKSSSVLKRRYTKGYYVHHAGRHGEPKVNEKTKSASITTPETVSEAVKTVEVKPYKNTKVITASAEQLQQKSTAVPAVKQNEAKALQNAYKAKVLPAAFSVQKQFALVEELMKKAKSADAADDALSLLWIVIVILLIIYLLGFAFDTYGIGPIYNLLALIIVVLLILWLLRIL